MSFFLSPTVDDFGNTFDLAHAIALSSVGRARQFGILEKTNDVDMFSFVAPLAGRMTITSSALPGNFFVGSVAVFDATFHQLAEGASATFDVVEKQKYFVRAAGSGGIGTYLLTFDTAATNIIPTVSAGLASFLNQDTGSVTALPSTAFILLVGNPVSVPSLILAANISGSAGASSGAAVRLETAPSYEAIFGNLPMSASATQADAELSQGLFHESGLLVFLSGTSLHSGESGEGQKHWPPAELFPISERAWAFIATLLPANAAERGLSDEVTPVDAKPPLRNDLDDLFLQGHVRAEPGSGRPLSFRDAPRTFPHRQATELTDRDDTASSIVAEGAAPNEPRGAAFDVEVMEAPASRPWLATLLASVLAIGALPALTTSDRDRRAC